MNTDLTFLVKLVTDWLHANSRNGDTNVHVTSSVIASSTGTKRRENQDRVALVEVKRHSALGGKLRAAAVFDGIGGMIDGGGAASLALASWAVYLGAGDSSRGLKSLMQSAANYANKSVFQKYLGRGGSTIAAAIFGSQGGVSLNAGDSKVFSVDGGVLTQLSTDDTLSARIAMNSSMLDPWMHPERIDNRLAQFVGMGDGFEPHLVTLKTSAKQQQPSSVLLLSDGAFFVGNAILERVLQRGEISTTSAEHVLRMAEWLGSDDNASIASLTPSLDELSSISAAETTFITIYCFGSSLTVLVPTGISDPLKPGFRRRYPQDPVDSNLTQPSIQFPNHLEKPVAAPRKKKPTSQNSKRSKVKKTETKKRKGTEDFFLELIPHKK